MALMKSGKKKANVKRKPHKVLSDTRHEKKKQQTNGKTVLSLYNTVLNVLAIILTGKYSIVTVGS